MLSGAGTGLTGVGGSVRFCSGSKVRSKLGVELTGRNDNAMSFLGVSGGKVKGMNRGVSGIPRGVRPKSENARSERGVITKLRGVARGSRGVARGWKRGDGKGPVEGPERAKGSERRGADEGVS